MTTRPRTLFDKIWDSHVIAPQGEGTYLIYIDLHLIHEVTTPQAFEGLKLAGRKVRRPDATFAVADHNIPTSNRQAGIDEPESRLQVETLERNVVEFGVPYFPIDSLDQGIVHIIGPEQGLSQPGMTIVCGDSHTATHGAMGALAFGIGTSEVEHVLATQTLIQAHAKNMLVEVNGGARRRGQPEGRDPRDHRQDRHRRRHRPCHRIRRQHVPRDVDGRPHDGLQHDDRGRRPRRPRRAGRDDLRLCQRNGAMRRRATHGSRPSPIGRRCPPTPARITTRRCRSTPARSRRTSPGAPTRSRPRRSPARCPTRPRSTIRCAAPRSSARCNTCS